MWLCFAFICIAIHASALSIQNADTLLKRAGAIAGKKPAPQLYWPNGFTNRPEQTITKLMRLKV